MPIEHCTSVAAVDSPLAFVAGVVVVAAVGTGVAQIHGDGCTLSRIGPLIGWLVTLSEAGPQVVAPGLPGSVVRCLPG